MLFHDIVAKYMFCVSAPTVGCADAACNERDELLTAVRLPHLR